MSNPIIVNPVFPGLNYNATGIKNAFRTKNLIATGLYSSIGSKSGQNYLGEQADINLIGNHANYNIVGQESYYNDFGSYCNRNYFGFGAATNYYGGYTNLFLGDLFLNQSPYIYGYPSAAVLNQALYSNIPSNATGGFFTTALAFNSLATGTWIFETFELYTGSSKPRSLIQGFGITFEDIGSVSIRGTTTLTAVDTAVDNRMSPTTGEFLAPANFSTITRKGTMTVEDTTNSLLFLFACNTTNSLTYLMQGSYLKVEKLQSF